MATTYKVLGQSIPAANTFTTLYTVPTNSNAVCSTLAICNQGVDTTVRVAVRPLNASLQSVHYLFYELRVAASDTMLFTLGLTLAASDAVTVYSGTPNVSFHLYGSVVT